MASEHQHHAHDRTAIGNNLLIAVLITSVVFAAELIGGILTNSLALMSDAGHMFVDVLSLLMSYFALKLAVKPASGKNTFGLYRIEILVALFNGVTLIFLSFFIIFEAYKRVADPQEVNTVPMIIIAVIGLVSNIVSGLIIHGDSEENLNVKGAYWHVIGDALSSIGVILAGVIMYLFSWYTADPIISFVIALIILKGAWTLIRESVNILLEAAPEQIDILKIVSELQELSGSKEVHHLHLWTISSNVYALNAHIRTQNMQIEQTEEILDKIRTTLKEKYNIQHVNIQFECNSCREA